MAKGRTAGGERGYGSYDGGTGRGPAPVLPTGCFCAACGAWSGQLGAEPHPQLYVANLVEVFAAVRRVLRPDGVLFVVLGDSYAGSWGNYAPGGIKGTQRQRTEGGERWERPAYGDTRWLPPAARGTGLRDKNLLGMPWRVAFGLQDDGWILRSDIVWSKKNCMPESVKDRPTRSHEYVFMFAKEPSYYYDAAAIAEPVSAQKGNARTFRGGNAYTGGRSYYNSVPVRRQTHGNVPNQTQRRNKRTVWSVSPMPFSGKKYGADIEHFAVFPSELIRPMICAATSAHGVCAACGAPWERVVERPVLPPQMRNRGPETKMAFHTRQTGGGQKQQEWYDAHPAQTMGWRPGCTCESGDPIPATVLDPFGGAGTTGVVAREEGRHAVLIDLNPDYLDLARARLRAELGLFSGVIEAGVSS